MKTVWKVLLGLALVVPLAAYVAGSLAASAADDPSPRQTIVIKDDPTRPSAPSTPSESPVGSPSVDPPPPTSSETAGIDTVELDPDDLHDDSDDWGRDDSGHGSDNSGPGSHDDGGHDDNSGSGGGDDG